MDPRSVFLGSKLRIAATILVGFVLLVGGLFAVGVFGVPSVVGVDNGFGTVNSSTTEIVTQITVDNPNPIGIGLGTVTVDYTVFMNDVRMATGEKHGIGIDPGNATIELRTYLDNSKIPAWWVSHVQNGEQTALQVKADIFSGFGLSTTRSPVERTIETDLLGTFNSSENRELNANQPPIEDPVAVIRQQNASWGQVDNQTTRLNVSFVVYNPNSYPVTVTQLSYNITMNDIVMGDGATDDPHTIPPKDTEIVQATLKMDTQQFDEWWVSHLRNGQVTELRINFGATVSASDLGTVTVSLDQLTYQRTVETDIFGGGTTPANASDSESQPVTTLMIPTTGDGLFELRRPDGAFFTMAALV